MSDSSWKHLLAFPGPIVMTLGGLNLFVDPVSPMPSVVMTRDVSAKMDSPLCDTSARRKDITNARNVSEIFISTELSVSPTLIVTTLERFNSDHPTLLPMQYAGARSNVCVTMARVPQAPLVLEMEITNVLRARNRTG